jgi:hypothetical protein
MTATHKMGGDSVVTNTLGIQFTDGSYQSSAALAPTLQCGVAVCTGSSSVVTFLQNYIGEQAPVVFITQIGTTPNGASASVHVNGTNGAWTGFTLELSSSFFGAYSWVSVGNPN